MEAEIARGRPHGGGGFVEVLFHGNQPAHTGHLAGGLKPTSFAGVEGERGRGRR
jgi:hypothetical protein